MARCLLALGSNLGDRRAILMRATGMIAALPRSQLLARSRWHETEPIGGPGGQSTFLNGSLLIETRLETDELSIAVHEIERTLGRQRVVRWDARTIDIDLLLYELQNMESEQLTIPHPRMCFRRFVLEPACEIAGSMIHPTCGWTLAQLLRHLNTAPRYLAVTAGEPALARQLAARLSQALRCPQLEEQLRSSATGPDSQPAEAVESIEGNVEKLREARWQESEELAARLTTSAVASLPPVISSFFHANAEPGLVRPALVIVWQRPNEQSSHLQSLDHPGHGPVARILEEEFSVVVSEALAAICAAWPALLLEEAN